jgi:hypothetical protein
MRQGTLVLSPKINGNEDENDGAACTAGKLIFPMGLLSSKPKIPKMVEISMSREITTIPSLSK